MLLIPLSLVLHVSLVMPPVTIQSDTIMHLSSTRQRVVVGVDVVDRSMGHTSVGACRLSVMLAYQATTHVSMVKDHASLVSQTHTYDNWTAFNFGRIIDRIDFHGHPNCT